MYFLAKSFLYIKASNWKDVWVETIQLYSYLGHFPKSQRHRTKKSLNGKHQTIATFPTLKIVNTLLLSLDILLQLA